MRSVKLLKLRNRGIVLARCKRYKSQHFPNPKVHRVQFGRVGHLFHGCVVASQGLQKTSILLMCRRVVGTQLNSEFVLPLGFRPIPVVEFYCLGEHEMSLPERGIKFHRPGCRRLGQRQRFFSSATPTPRITELNIGICHTGVCRPIFWVLLNGPPQVTTFSQKALLTVVVCSDGPFISDMQGTEVIFL